MKTAKRKFILPTAKEEAAIAAGIAADPDSLEMSGAEMAEAARVKRGRGRPVGSVAEQTKETVSMRLDPDLLEAMRSSGKGWQTRVNEILRREFVAEGKRAARTRRP